MKHIPKILALAIIGVAVFVLSRCQDDEGMKNQDCQDCPPGQVGTPYDLKVPKGFPQPNIPADNSMTVEGVKLGRYLFYEKKLSADQSLSCGSCHMQKNFFSDETPTSTGINGAQGQRRAMPLFNLAFQENFFWDGRAGSLEEQAHKPIIDPNELGNDFETIISRLESDTLYPPMFKAAFGSQKITEERILKAIAQFERTIISANSKFDKVVRLNTGEQFTALEQQGFDMFTSEEADCFHCHGHRETRFIMGAFGRDLQFSNNGSKAQFEDEGRAEVTGKESDVGKFKIPTVRNIVFASAFMHDGGMPNDGLDSLIEFYNFGGHPHPNIDPNMKTVGVGQNWTETQKDALKAFLRTLTDFSFLDDSAYANPHTQ